MSDDYDDEPEFRSYADEMFDRNIADANKRKQEFEDAMREHLSKWKVGMHVTDGKFTGKILRVNQYDGKLLTTPPRPVAGNTDCFHGWDEENMVEDKNPPPDEPPKAEQLALTEQVKEES